MAEDLVPSIDKEGGEISQRGEVKDTSHAFYIPSDLRRYYAFVFGVIGDPNHYWCASNAIAWIAGCMVFLSNIL